MKCAICNKEMKAISWRHLKTHDMTTAEYKSKYGAVISEEHSRRISERVSGDNNPNYGKKRSDEVKQKISTSNKGKTPPNKGKAMSSQQKELLSVKALERNSNNKNPNIGSKRSEETKAKIREARAKQVITQESVQKAIQTKRDRGYDLAFFRGKHHTQQTKEIISQRSIESNRKRSEQSRNEAIQRMEEHGYSVLSIEDKVMTVQCNECKNTFMRTYQYSSNSKINSEMCNICHPPIHGTSKAEEEIAEFLKQYTSVIRNTRSVIAPSELDIYLPDHNIAIEYNGLYWHSDVYKDDNYHNHKTIICNDNGIRLIHIFEDEYLDNPDIVKSRLLTAIGKSSVLYARKCTIREISPNISNTFINDNHIQGSGRANVHLGLYHDNELVSVMTFLRGDISKKVEGWELNRFCNKMGMSVVGGASRLFKHFVKNYSPSKITSFADRRWSNITPFYEKIGFKHVHDSKPNYWYVPNGEIKRLHRYGLRKPQGCEVTERELRESQGYLRIYDCGSAKYEWNM